MFYTETETQKIIENKTLILKFRSEEFKVLNRPTPLSYFPGFWLETYYGGVDHLLNDLIAPFLVTQNDKINVYLFQLAKSFKKCSRVPIFRLQVVPGFHR